MSLNDSIFTFNGVRSDTMGVRIQVRPDRISPTRNFYEGTPSNRNGTVLRDKGTYSDASLKLTCFYETYKTDKSIDDVLDWLSTKDFVPLILNYDPDYQYSVIVKSSITLSALDWEHTVYSFVLDLLVNPMKISLTKNQVVTLANTDVTVANPFKYVARPYFDIKASSSFTMQISSGSSFEDYSNFQKYTFSNPGGEIVIDSDLKTASKPGNFLGQQFPYLLPGTNVITFSGIKSATMRPNYSRKVG